MLKKICSIISTVIIAIMVVIGGLLLVPQLLGYKTFAIVSGSMEPNIVVGSLAYAKEVPFEDLKVDDIISFQTSSNTMVTHRIYKIDLDKQEVITKGDANSVVDGSPVKESQIIGRVGFVIPVLGYFSLYIRSITGLVSLIILLVFIILLEILPDKISKTKI